MGSHLFRQLRALLSLGRVSNLPTVWSNCLAGWWLGGGENASPLPFLFSGATLLYMGGMFLNDAFDADFDRQHRRERPIPSGMISAAAVWRWGVAWLLAGLGLLFLCGAATGAWSVALALAIVLYNAIHKRFVLSPALMGGCRCLLYLMAAATGGQGVTGTAVWCGLALAAYVTGLSFLARGESTGVSRSFWPVLLLAAPVALAQLLNVGAHREPALWLSLILALWVARCLRTTFWTANVNVGRTVSGLLAGMVLVDWLAVAPAAGFPPALSITFLVLFGAALGGQRLIPAT